MLKSISLASLGCLLAFGTPRLCAEDSTEQSKAALRALGDLANGQWRGIGEPEGTRAEKRRGFWTENVYWKWQFTKGEPALIMTIEKGKHLQEGEMRYLPDAKKYQLKVTTPDNKSLTYEGKLDGKNLVLEREDPKTKDVQRLAFTFLRSNRYLYHYEEKPADRSRFKRVYSVGVTDRSEPFAGKGDSIPECIVSGGRGTTPVSYNGKTYYVCCSGCASEFKDNPAKYVKEFEAKLEKEKK